MLTDSMSHALGIRRYRLAGPKGDGRHAYLNEGGAYLGPGVSLLSCVADSRDGKFFAPRAEAVLGRILSAAYGKPVDCRALTYCLKRIAAALNRGDRALAAILLVQAQIEPLPDAAAARRLAKADRDLRVHYGRGARSTVKSGFNPDEPRVSAGEEGGGEWTDGGDGSASPNVTPATAQGEDIQAKKQSLVDAHLADAQKAADQLGIPVENILGFAALESGWGEKRFAADGNNYFGLHYPAPFATSYMLTEDGRIKVATFNSFADNLASFIAESGTLVQGLSDPVAFATALQNSGKYGVYRNGTPVANYVQGVAATIRGLRPIVEQRSP